MHIWGHGLDSMGIYCFDFVDRECDPTNTAVKEGNFLRGEEKLFRRAFAAVALMWDTDATYLHLASSRRHCA
jgi:hypothetical protein